MLLLCDVLKGGFFSLPLLCSEFEVGLSPCKSHFRWCVVCLGWGRVTEREVAVPYGLCTVFEFERGFCWRHSGTGAAACDMLLAV